MQRLLTGLWLAFLLTGGRVEAAPTNDSFVNAIVLTGSGFQASGTNVTASKEFLEPNHAGNAGGHSVWWSWMAPSSGAVTLSTAGSDFPTLLGVYTGNAVSMLAQVAAAGHASSPATVTFRATAGVNYKIAVDGFNGVSGNILLSLILRTAPANDNFASRIAIASGSQVVGQTLGATKETSEPNHAGDPGGKSLWWTWTAASNGCVRITSEGSAFDTMLGVYTGTTLGTLSPVATNDEANVGFQSTVAFIAVAGQAYQIAVDGYNGAAGDCILRVLPFTAPTNDAFASATMLSGTNVSLVTSNLCATKESGEPDHDSNPAANRFGGDGSPLSSGGATFDLAGSDFATHFAVYTGASLGALTEVVSGRDHGVFKAVAGTTYRIAVDGFQLGTLPAESGTISLKLTLLPSPANDDFANRTTLGTNALAGANAGATAETNEPAHSQGLLFGSDLWGRSVWWTWTSPFTGPAAITTLSSNFFSVIAIYTGNSVANLTWVSARVGFTPTNQVVFQALAGTTYQIAVDGVAGSTGSFSILRNQLSAPTNNAFTNRLLISGSNAYVTGWNVGATRELNEPVHARVSGSNSVWWRWATPISGRLFLTTLGSSFSPALAVYQGASVSTLISNASNYSPIQCPRFSTVAMDIVVVTNCGAATCWVTNQIAVDGMNGESGAIGLALTFVPRPANDNFAGRTALAGSFLVVTGSVIAASQEAGEVLDGNSNGLRTVWYSWTAPTNTGRVTLRVTGINFVLSDPAPIVGVFQGNSLATLTTVAVTSEAKGNIRQITFQPQPGGVYRIAVAAPGNTGTGYDTSFAQRRGLTQPGALEETGSFLLRLSFSTVTLQVKNLLPAHLGFGDFGKKVLFGAEAQAFNYESAPTRPVRVRLVGLAMDGAVTGELGSFTPVLGSGIAPGGSNSVPIYGICPPQESVLAVLEENFEGNWFYRDSSLILTGLGVLHGLCFTVTGGGVAVLEPGLSGACFCPPRLTSVQINGPNSVTEGRIASYWGTAAFDNGAMPNFTNSIWTTSNTNGFPITTNGVLTAGNVTNNTTITVSTLFSYASVVQSTNKAVVILNLPPPVLTNLVRLADRNVRLTLSGVEERQHAIDATTNLAAPTIWTALMTNTTSLNGSFNFTDLVATNYPRRFYRAREF